MPEVFFDLAGQWQFTQYPTSARKMSDLDSEDWLPASVPNSIFNNLIEAGRIDQTDINTNPEDFAWVSEKPWIYKKTFDAPAELTDCDRINLIFDGLDTIATIWLNDKLIAKTNNMFIGHNFDVTEFLKPKDNHLLVKFDPPAEYAQNLMDRYIPFSQADILNPHRAYIRKAQYQFGWDFCPSLPGCGIFRPVYLEGIKKAAITDLNIQTVKCDPKSAEIKIDIAIDALIKEKFFCEITISFADLQIQRSLAFNPGDNFHSTLIRIDSPALWWPAGYGQQNLYQLDVQLRTENQIVDCAQEKFGIRTVKLDRSADGQNQKFQFVINGQPVFAKGTNWIPPSIFAGSATAIDYENLLIAAKNANINMLRIWGGGYYESQHFYQLCDQLGIMIWQDFMFACSYYPDSQWFLDQINTEAIEIIKQLRSHPCMVLWCGNNEIDWMHHTNRLGKSRKFHGRNIFHKLLPRLTATLDPTTPYIPTTPLCKKDKYDTDRHITAHNWDVWSGRQPVRQYLCPSDAVPPFVTEFGLQSIPDFETTKNFCDPAQLRIAARTLEKHNYQLDGNSRLHRYVGDLLGPTADLEHFTYLSQLTQARAAKTYVEHLRAHNLKNSGVLFWQFNDCAPAITWSAVDYLKKPKALYYYAKRFFANRLITITADFEPYTANKQQQFRSLNAVVINDTSQPLTATLDCQLMDLTGHLIDKINFPLALGPFSSSVFQLPKEFAHPNRPQNSALYLLVSDDKNKIAENLFFYLPDKYIDWPNAKIEKQFSQISKDKWSLKLKSEVFVRDLRIDCPQPVQCSDNFIDLIPQKNTEVQITAPPDTALSDSVIMLKHF